MTAMPSHVFCHKFTYLTNEHYFLKRFFSLPELVDGDLEST